jgi:hypothetical protein
MIPNGGFPPIHLCKTNNKNKINNKNGTQSKERDFAPKINIKQIFNIDKKKLITPNKKEEDLEEV